MKPHFVYIITNAGRRTLYTGMTDDLFRRLMQHYQHRGDPRHFSTKYHCYYLLMYEEYPSFEDAMRREKQLKGWRREKKWNLIRSVNPNLEFMQLPQNMRYTI